VSSIEKPDIRDLVRAGEPLVGETIVDCHCHMGPWQTFCVFDGDAAGMVRTMDRCGIDVACAAHHSAIGPDVPGGNTEVAHAMADFPGRFAGYCTLNGRHSSQAVVAELEKHIVDGGFRGIKLHPAFHQCPLDAETLAPAFELANERQLPVLVHTWLGDSRATPGMFERLAERYPEAWVILGHTGGCPEGMELYLPVVRAHDNILCDLCGSLMNHGIIERLVNEIGDERVLFGSDLPFIDCRPMLGYIGFANVSDESKRRILGQNAARIFGLTV